MEKKERDLIQSDDKNPNANLKIQKRKKSYNTKTLPEPSTTQRLQTNLDRLVGETIVTQMVMVNR